MGEIIANPKALGMLKSNKAGYYDLTTNNLDSAPNARTIGIGLISNVGYFAINMDWIHAQFRVSDKIYARVKYGDGAWTSWNALY